MTKTRQSGFIDRYVVAVVAMALVGSLAMAAETGLKPSVASSHTDTLPPAYVLPDARIAPFIDRLFFD